jgi:hypothetical protein
VSWATCCLQATGSVGLPWSLLQNGNSHTQGTDYIFVQVLTGDCGGTVVKVLCYKLESRWFDSRWCHWNFSLT